MKRRNRESRARIQTIQEYRMNKDRQLSLDRLHLMTGVPYVKLRALFRLKNSVIIAARGTHEVLTQPTKSFQDIVSMYQAKVLTVASREPDLHELDKLEAYLKQHGIQYERFDEDRVIDGDGCAVNQGRHQIVGDGWDAICHRGSYGYEDGLLEVMGSRVVPESEGYAVCGYLTAEDVIARLEGADAP